MKLKILTAHVTVLLASAALQGQRVPAASAPTQSSPNARPQPTVFYLHSFALQLDSLIPPPPGRQSSVTIAELNDLHRIELSRTAPQVAQAQMDDREQDIFIFESVLGSQFNAGNLPLTEALSAHVHDDESAVSGPLKNIYQRPRPYQLDATLHPVCAMNPGPTSYPSGHSLSGYLLALTLVQMVPEKREEIFERADTYAHNRLVCGVHYASDTEASRRLAYALFASIAASPRFQQDLAAAREETRRRLGLPATPFQR